MQKDTPGGMVLCVVLAWQALRAWDARRWWSALLSGVVIALIVAIPTAVIPTPIFGRSIEPTWWSLPVVVLTGILGGLVFATYVRPAGVETPITEQSRERAPAPDSSPASDRPSKVAIAGGALAYFAVGCPVCNKLVLLALGASGAVTWFAPLQGFLALASLVLMGWALFTRLRGQVACEVTPSTEATGTQTTDSVSRR